MPLARAMYPTGNQPTIETIVVDSALVVVMAALRKKRFAGVDGSVLGFALWATVVSVSWGTAKLLDLSQLHFWRMHLEPPVAFAALFLSMRAFWGRRLWFVKGFALYCGILGAFVGLDEVLHFDTNRLRSFVLSSLAFALVCGVLSARREGPATDAPVPAAEATRGTEPL